jgi:hypothetical protein
MSKEGEMVCKRVVAIVLAAGLLGACEQPLTTPQKGALSGAAIGTGIGLATGGSFGQVVGGGLIGGGIGYLGGSALDRAR